ncbi:MAG: hypothetical protein ABIJ97_02375 [Bacteroidota bacterium]
MAVVQTSTISQERMDGYIHISVKGEIEPGYEYIVKVFIYKKIM